ncbi:uncharacterized protein [Chironomus tepperi]|uniref:uncharacterized protein isoform X3 n=1 Tax=Chironomus tepperi TaxID=113505 RepID=UPI00391F1AD1
MNEYSIKLFLLLTVLYINNVTATTEDDCIVLYLEDRKLLNSPSSSVIQRDSAKHEECLSARIIHNEPQKTKLERIRDGILYNIKYKCSGAFHNGSISRFNEFVSDMGPSEAATNRLAYPKIIENLPCINQYAIDKGILSADKYNLKSTKGDCVKAVNEVMSLIRLEWDMQKASDDENTQKCLINTLKEIATEATFIKLTLLSQLNLTKEQQDAEREDFIAHTLNLREEVYNCLNKEFDEL